MKYTLYFTRHTFIHCKWTRVVSTELLG